MAESIGSLQNPNANPSVTKYDRDSLWGEVTCFGEVRVGRKANGV